MKPFRILSAILILIIAGEVYAITMTPTYETELSEVRTAYETAAHENLILKKALGRSKLTD